MIPTWAFDSPIPSFYSDEKVGTIYPVDHDAVEAYAREYASYHKVLPAADVSGSTWRKRVCLLLIDVQLTFCHPSYELPVSGAIDDCARTCRFIYENLDAINHICLTMDTHCKSQIFHPFFFTGIDGHPAPGTQITVEDLVNDRWHVNRHVQAMFPNVDLDTHIYHYVRALAKSGRLSLTTWPYHAMLGSVGHAIVPAVYEAVWFHAAAKNTQPRVVMKGQNMLTENYSVFRPEVLADLAGNPIADENAALRNFIMSHDAVIVAGQAKSHCVAWSVADMIENATEAERMRVYLVEDMTSPVVVPGVVDFTQAADAAFDEFRKRGVNVVRSTTPVSEWPGFPTND